MKKRAKISLLTIKESIQATTPISFAEADHKTEVNKLSLSKMSQYNNSIWVKIRLNNDRNVFMLCQSNCKQLFSGPCQKFGGVTYMYFCQLQEMFWQKSNLYFSMSITKTWPLGPPHHCMPRSLGAQVYGCLSNSMPEVPRLVGARCRSHRGSKVTECASQ